MNEAETRAEHVDPALRAAGWGVVEGSRVRREYPITKGRIQPNGRRATPLSADYVLVYRNTKLAVIEAKAWDKPLTAGLGQAKNYADMMAVRFAYATNGQGLYGVDMETGQEGEVAAYPTPEELWNRTFDAPNAWRDRFAAVPFEDKGGSHPARYYQDIAVERVLEAIAKGRERILLTLATGTGKTFIAFQIAWKLFYSRWNLDREPTRRPRILFLADRNVLASQAYNNFSAFPEDALVRIDPSEIRKRDRVPTNGSLFFTIFQTFMASAGSATESTETAVPELVDGSATESTETAVPELVDGAATESTETAVPELVDGAATESIETAVPELVEGAKLRPAYGYMYILGCADGSFYTGSTRDLNRRLEQHRAGDAARYTRTRLPVKLLYYEAFDRIDAAFAREKQVQGWSRAKKVALIRGDLTQLKRLSQSKSPPSAGSASAGSATEGPATEGAARRGGSRSPSFLGSATEGPATEGAARRGGSRSPSFLGSATEGPATEGAARRGGSRSPSFLGSATEGPATEGAVPELVEGYFGDYPPDFFDFIVVDECHRGGANDESTWRDILDYFAPAVQLGLTATPKRDDNVDTYAYFGEPVYVYSLKEGINDGFLTPFKVKQISTTLDEYVYTANDRVMEGEVEFGKRYTERDFNTKIEISAREAERVRIFMDQIDQSEKTLVFCASQDHALAVRDLVNQLKTSADPNYCHRVTADDGMLGEQWLRTFQDNEKTIPTVLTTSHKLSTGVDARNIRNIVLMRPINSMIEFKQIVGRGTRLFEGKAYFTIYDFVKAHHHFNDPEWDGEPLEPEPTEPRRATPPPPPPDPSVPRPPRPPRVKVKLADGKARTIQHMTATTFWHPDGTPMSAQQFMEMLFGRLPEFFQDEAELRKLWSDPETRGKLLQGLTEKGFGGDQLAEMQRIIGAEQSDLFDVLAHVAYALPPVTREERAARAKVIISTHFNTKQQVFLDFVLSHYVCVGVEELGQEKLPPLLKLKYDAIADAVADLGKPEDIREVFSGFQKYLYQLPTAA